ncbi:MAG: hypothetical protein QG605_2340 [Euryarchaeota archaeon]|nr:hypothetical protein [Euryarchaeota archaeon]
MPRQRLDENQKLYLSEIAKDGWARISSTCLLLTGMESHFFWSECLIFTFPLNLISERNSSISSESMDR